MEGRKLRVGLCGAGLGGLAAAIAIARAGCDVTLLEAANELGEIGAGIQMVRSMSWKLAISFVMQLSLTRSMSSLDPERL